MYFVLSIALALQAAAPGPGDTAQVFAPGVVSTGNVYRGSFSPDGREFFWFRKMTPGTEHYRIFRSRLAAGSWSAPEVVDLGASPSDLYPAVSPDGRWLLFSSYRPAPGDTSSHANAHIWAAPRSGDGWGTPVFLAGANRLGYYHSGLTFVEGGWLHFGRATPDFRTGTSHRARWANGRLSTPERYADGGRWTNWRKDRHLWDARPAPGGRALILEISPVDTVTGRRGPSDLWISERRGSDWTEPRPLGAGVNSPGTENFIFFSPDGRELFYVRNFEAVRHVSLAAALASRPDSARPPRLLATISGFAIPESARRDNALDRVFVSNVSGSGLAKDNDGFISRLLPDGTVDSLRFIAGGRDGVTLHAPRGMAIRRDTLWVADLDAVRAFSTRTGASLATVDLAPLGALFLNDAATGPDGALYVTDTGFRTDSAGRTTHTGPDRIFRIAGGRAEVALETPRLRQPNGLTWDAAGRRFIVVSLADSALSAWTPGDTTLTPLARGPARFDGIEPTIKGYLVSSLTGSISLLADGALTPLITGIRTPADIGWDPSRSRLYIPQLGENTVQIWELP